MGLDFLAEFAAGRAGAAGDPPELMGDSPPEPATYANINLDYERPRGQWKPRGVADCAPPQDWPWHPRRWVDGKSVGRTIAWLRSPQNFLVPVRLGQIGGVAMRRDDPNRALDPLRREYSDTARIVVMAADLFPWNRVEGFARALRPHGFQLVICHAPGTDEDHRDRDQLRGVTMKRATEEMLRLEKQALAQAGDVPTLVDGRLEDKAGSFAEAAPVVAVVKRHKQNYLDDDGWQTFYDLQPAQRTPAFLLTRPADTSGGAAQPQIRLDTVTWYLRLCGGLDPDHGIVRVEISRAFYETRLNSDPAHIDRLSNLIVRYRTHDAEYGRAPVTLQPIQRAEQSLESLFTPMDTLISRFYHLTRI